MTTWDNARRTGELVQDMDHLANALNDRSFEPVPPQASLILLAAVKLAAAAAGFTAAVRENS